MPTLLLFAILAILGLGGVAAAADAPAKTDQPVPRAAPSGPSIGAARDRSKGAAAYQGPTETDLRDAYRARIDRVNAGSERFLDAPAAARMHIALKKVDLVECDSVDERTDLYRCNIVVESAVGDAGSELRRREAILAKEGQTWTLR